MFSKDAQQVQNEAGITKQEPNAIEKLKNMTSYLESLNTVHSNTLAEPIFHRVRNKRK